MKMDFKKSVDFISFFIIHNSSFIIIRLSSFEKAAAVYGYIFH